MTIRNRLLILAFAPIIMLIVIASVSLLVRQQVADDFQRRELVADVTLGIFDLNLLTTDYVQSGLERAEVQWQARYQSVGDTISGVQVTSVEGQLVLDRLRASYDKFGALFSSLVVVTREAKLYHEEIAENLASELFKQSQTMVTDCSILASIAGEELLNAQQQAAYIFWPTLILAVLGGLAGSLLIHQSIAKPVRELTKGAEIVGTGNLDYRVGTSAKDEIGVLSRAFDKMTKNLKAVSVSRNELAVEVTERKQVEAALRETHDYLEKLIQYASAPIIVWMPTLEITRFNRAFECLTDYAVDEVIGKQLTMLFPEANQAELLRKIAQASAGEYWSSVEIPILTKDGKTTLVLWNSANIYADDATTLLATIAQGIDITERKQAEEERVKAVSTIVDAMGDALLMHTMDGKVTYVNPAFERMTGCDNSELVGKSATQVGARFTNPQDAQITGAAIENVLKGEMSTSALTPVTIVSADGRETPVLITPSFMRDAKGEPTTLVIVYKDITNMKEAEQELKQTVADLKRSNAELERFAYVASHDLQEPLRMVSSFTQLLARRYRHKLDTDADEFIGYAVDGAKRMQELLNDLLSYSRVGTRGKSFETTDCNAVFDAAVANLAVAIRDTGAELTHDPLPVVMADEVQLAQLLQNLIDNAIKFRGEEPPRAHVSAEQKGDEWVFSVRDNGIGVDPQYFKRVFIIFQRLQRQDYPGTGIGLSIAKSIVERHGGRIWLESQPGEGSTVNFTIPAKGGGNRGETGGRSRAATGGKRKIRTRRSGPGIRRS